MFTNGINVGLLQQAWVEKKVHRVKTNWLSSKKVLGTVVNKEGDVDSLLGHERTHHYWFHCKMSNCKQCFQLPTAKAKFFLNESHI